ncbi:MAG: hypothetical protein OXD00_00335 [Gammaproteobacteria bacterium]|nr:hypothetical protein [Gammaproteobacteria bacterium]
MKLEHLRIEQLPGLSESFVLRGLAEGVNLVTAPNAFGKSSIVRALGYLLRDPQQNDPPVSLAADLSDGVDGKDAWRVTRTGSHIEWQHNGKTTVRPALPTADELGRYWLSMENLIVASDQDKQLASELIRDLRGGFDLGAARIKLRDRHGQNETRELNNAHKDLRNAENEALQLAGEEARLPEIGRAIEQARRAEDLCKHIRTAQQLAETVKKRVIHQAALEAFPPGMEEIARIDSNALDTLNDQIDAARTEIRVKQRTRDDAIATLETLGLSSDEIAQAETHLAAALTKLSNLQSAREQLARQETEAASLSARVRKASDALGGGEMPRLNRESLHLAEGFAVSLLKHKTKAEDLATQIELAGEAPAEELIRQHEQGVEALREWLNATQSRTSGSQAKWPLAFAFVAALASLGASALDPILGMLGIGVSLVGIGIAWWRFGAKQDTSGQQDAEKRFEQTGLNVPNWDTHAVREALKPLEAELAKFIAKRSLAEGGGKLRLQLEKAQQALQEKETERTQLAEEIGFDPAMPLTELDRFIRLAKDWDDAKLSLAESEADIERSKALMSTMAQEASDLLRAWRVEASTDSDMLTAEVDKFRERLKSAKDAGQMLDVAQRDLHRLEADIKQRETERSTLYQRVGVEDGDYDEFSRRLEQRDDWAMVKKQLDAANTLEAQDRRALEGAEDLIELAASENTDQLAILLDERQGIAEKLEALIEERTQINTRIKQAEAGSEVQSAATRVKERLADLEEKRDQQLISDATDILLDDVELAYTSEHQPQVLQEAGDLLREVTAHKFSLKLSDDGVFEAFDERQSARRDLDQLSTGTRMQALLAVRMAWVRHRQAGALNLPMFLDEALTTSDEQRFMDIAKTLQTLARSTGTQIVYLSARQSERALWEAAIGESLHCIDLRQERDDIRREELDGFPLPPRQATPKPQGSPEDYAKALAVPGIDPNREAGEIHLFHLLRDDLDGLHRLIDVHRISTVGQLESLLEHAPSSAGEAEARLHARCRATRTWVLAWRQGRGRTLGAADMEASGIISDAFLSDARSLLTSSDVDGDARRFSDALQEGKLKGFRAKTREALDDWLESKGFIDRRPRLSPEERFSHVMQVLGAEDRTILGDVGQCLDWLEAGLK